MKKIKLTQGQFAQVDDSDYPWLNVWKWHARRCKFTYYALRASKRINGKQKVIHMHRLIMNTPDNEEVDHRDFNGLNCQRHNMRNCTHGQNMKNRKSRGRSRYLGVHILDCTIKGKIYSYIVAQIYINGKNAHLGCFKTEELAAKAYDEKAKEIHGEFANLNFKEFPLNKGEA